MELVQWQMQSIHGSAIHSPDSNKSSRILMDLVHMAACSIRWVILWNSESIKIRQNPRKRNPLRRCNSYWFWKECLVRNPLSRCNSCWFWKEPFMRNPLRRWNSCWFWKEPFVRNPLRRWNSCWFWKEPFVRNPTFQSVYSDHLQPSIGVIICPTLNTFLFFT